ncbi:MAG: succinylglutamate desuccinylase/aspartoacylase family protein [Alphaproteobacteria bacterium]|nr:succinylglutamate desuccinylase/aspartoacylase family protein [Alphaproteobacteria bacterium]
MRDMLIDWLARFDAVARPGPWPYPRVHHHEGGGHPFHLVIGSMVHGDEVGSLPAVVRVIEELVTGQRLHAGTVSFFVGNPEAGLQGQRFLEDDLNRVFMDDPPASHEGRRGALLRPLLDAADVFLDLHQTIEPTQHAFYIFPFQTHGWHWARALASTSMWVTRHPGTAFTTGAKCADEYVRDRGLPGITLELSQKGFGNGGEERAYQAITRALELSDAVAAGTTTLEEAAMDRPELTFLETVHREPFASEDLALRPGLQNFQEVAEGEVLSAPGTPELRAPCGGWVLFPKYPPRVEGGGYKKPLPGEIYRIVRAMGGHPVEVFAGADR